MQNEEAGADTVSSLSERDLITRIQSRLPPPPPWMIVGIGDDAAVVEPERNRLEVLTVDSVVEGVHFDRAFVPPEAIGYRALAVNLSDLAAMGASPRLALVAMALPQSLSLADFDAIVAGLCALAAEHRLHVAGGNLTRSPGPLAVDITVTGTVKRRQVLTRAGARPGDELYVSGTIGAAAAGLNMLKTRAGANSLSTTNSLVTTNSRSTTEDAANTEEKEIADHAIGDRRSESSVSSVSPVVESCVERYLRPQPRLRLGVFLGRNRAASACIDLSDGLADGVHRIAEASDVGIALDACALPIDPATRALSEARGGDAAMDALEGGDDYELLFASAPRMRRRVAAAARHAGLPLTRIGVCTEPPGVVLRRNGADTPLRVAGYQHFGHP